MRTARVPIVIAECPYCGGEVYLDSAEREDKPEDFIWSLDPWWTVPVATGYTLTHWAGRYPYAGFDEHRWAVDRFEMRPVFTMELTPQ